MSDIACSWVIVDVLFVRPKDPNHSAVGIRMGTLGGSYRQKSFFDQDDCQPNAVSRVSITCLLLITIELV